MRKYYTLLVVMMLPFIISFQEQDADPFGTYMDPRDGHVYKTVQIGGQVWLAENFAYLPYVCPADSFNCGVWVYNYHGTKISEARATSEYQKYGALYSWKAAKDLAPEGWHLPSDKDWQELEKYLGIDNPALESEIWRGTHLEADRLKKGGDTGFHAAFGGWMTDYGKFNFIEEHANFWCADEFDADRGYERLIGINNGKIGRDKGNKGCGFSARYVKD